MSVSAKYFIASLGDVQCTGSEDAKQPETSSRHDAPKVCSMCHPSYLFHKMPLCLKLQPLITSCIHLILILYCTNSPTPTTKKPFVSQLRQVLRTILPTSIASTPEVLDGAATPRVFQSPVPDWLETCKTCQFRFWQDHKCNSGGIKGWQTSFASPSSKSRASKKTFRTKNPTRSNPLKRIWSSFVITVWWCRRPFIYVGTHRRECFHTWSRTVEHAVVCTHPLAARCFIRDYTETTGT